MPFHNRVRLPLNLFAAQFGSTKSQYVKADGTIKVLSNQLKKTYSLTTDWMPETWHQRLVIALSHDNVNIEGEKYFGGVALDGNYQIDWDIQFRTPVAPGAVLVAVTPFDESNNNCMSCDEAGQLSLVDDTMPDPLEEDSTNVFDVTANDSICCSPVTFSITSFNTDYIDSASINADSGVVTFHVKTGLVAANGIKLLTYRATCFNGGYDEADLSADINGTIPGCLAPTNLILSSIGDTTFHAEWTAPSPAPGHYFWKILTNPGGVVLQSGDTPDVFFDGSGLDVNTEYTFAVASECADTDGDDESNFIQRDFITTPASPLHCGSFRVFPSAGASTGTITYLGCDGFYHTVAATILTPVIICALQSAPGVYTDIHSTFTTITVSYLDFCGGRPKATLSFRFVHAGSFLQFTESLSVPIDADITIDRVFSDGFPSMPCNAAVGSAQKNSPQFILAGGSGAGAPPEITSGTWAGVVGYSIYNVLVNGFAYINGSVVPIGSYDVTMDIPACMA